jgi:hypothetical protein
LDDCWKIEFIFWELKVVYIADPSITGEASLDASVICVDKISTATCAYYICTCSVLMTFLLITSYLKRHKCELPKIFFLTRFA